MHPPLPAHDLRDVPFLTIDPPGSTDLDQAMALSRTGDGYLVQYAIADVAAFDPPVLSEDRASLLADQDRSSAVAANYAHCTAPLRRLADRYVGEVCLALCAGTEIPSWARQALPILPVEMAAGDHRGHALDRAIVDLAEATVMQRRVGQSFQGVVVEFNGRAAPCSLPIQRCAARSTGRTCRWARRSSSCSPRPTS